VITERDILGMVDGTLEYSAVYDAHHSRPLSGYDNDAVATLEAVVVPHDLTLSTGHPVRQLTGVRTMPMLDQ